MQDWGMRGTASIWRPLLRLSSSECVAIRAICVGSKELHTSARQGKDRLKELLQQIGASESGGGRLYEAKDALPQCLASREIGLRHRVFGKPIRQRDSKWGQGRCKKALRKANRKVEGLTLLHPFVYRINETCLR